MIRIFEQTMYKNYSREIFLRPILGGLGSDKIQDQGKFIVINQSLMIEYISLVINYGFQTQMFNFPYLVYNDGNARNLPHDLL